EGRRRLHPQYGLVAELHGAIYLPGEIPGARRRLDCPDYRSLRRSQFSVCGTPRRLCYLKQQHCFPD
ncbi:MAG TPA: hypothetical protein VEH81_11620, partial [Ktedonobacteraceae bacterium]|nr:hypothetical protein [Ktedonobacteraceae bacterium]